MLFKNFIAEIKNKDLLQEGDTVVAAVSGGADSVCLLHLLYRLRPSWNLRLICAHVNHGIRSEAAEDASFVARLCKEWDIPFLLCEENVKEKAKEAKASVELVGREVRYRFFKSLEANVIMTAHNKNDAAESVLLHLIRGCGLDGLCGIPSRREDGICRPLLGFSREQIEAYLYENQLSWREDMTNFDTVYTRNKIRHTILPLIQKMNPSFPDTLSRMTEILKVENEYMDAQLEKYPVVRKEGEGVFFSIAALSEMPLALQRRAVSKEVKNFYETTSVLELLQKKNGSMCELAGGKVAEREYTEIAIYFPSKKQLEPIHLPEEGEVVFGEYRIIVGKTGMTLPKKEYMVRQRRNGDVFSPEGMEGRKKIKDFLIEKKIPRRLRDNIPILTHDDIIVAVGDFRRSNQFVPKNEDILHIKIKHI